MSFKVTHKEWFTIVENSIGNDLVMVLTALACFRLPCKSGRGLPNDLVPKRNVVFHKNPSLTGWIYT